LLIFPDSGLDRSALIFMVTELVEYVEKLLDDADKS